MTMTHQQLGLKPDDLITEAIKIVEQLEQKHAPDLMEQISYVIQGHYDSRRSVNKPTSSTIPTDSSSIPEKPTQKTPKKTRVICEPDYVYVPCGMTELWEGIKVPCYFKAQKGNIPNSPPSQGNGANSIIVDNELSTGPAKMTLKAYRSKIRKEFPDRTFVTPNWRTPRKGKTPKAPKPPSKKPGVTPTPTGASKVLRFDDGFPKQESNSSRRGDIGTKKGDMGTTKDSDSDMVAEKRECPDPPALSPLELEQRQQAEQQRKIQFLKERTAAHNLENSRIQLKLQEMSDNQKKARMELVKLGMGQNDNLANTLLGTGLSTALKDAGKVRAELIEQGLAGDESGGEEEADNTGKEEEALDIDKEMEKLEDTGTFLDELAYGQELAIWQKDRPQIQPHRVLYNGMAVPTKEATVELLENGRRTGIHRMFNFGWCYPTLELAMQAKADHEATLAQYASAAGTGRSR